MKTRYPQNFSHLGYEVNIAIEQDTDSGPPWKEADGHGIVTESRRYAKGWWGNKAPGERALPSERGYCRFYDFAGTMVIARRDGWGLSDEHKQELARKLGKPVELLTKGEITAASVERDFEYIRGWLADEWTWQGYVISITGPDGEAIPVEHDSCWGFEGTDSGEQYMLSDAGDAARHAIESHISLMAETQIAECCP